MHSTYINDNKASRWPFAAGVSLPFSDSSVLGLGICLALKSGPAPESVSVCAADISDDRVALSLMVDGVYVGSISAALDGYGTLPLTECVLGLEDESGSDTVADVSAWMLAGDALVKGSWRTDLPVDPSCVTVIPADCHDKMHSMTVNGVEHRLPEELELSTAGQYLELEPDGSDSVFLDGTLLPMDTYNSAGGLLLQVGEMMFRMSASRGQTLRLSFDESGGGERISVETLKDTDDEAARKGTQGLLVIRVRGTSQFPHCYGTADEADESDSYNA